MGVNCQSDPLILLGLMASGFYHTKRERERKLSSMEIVLHDLRPLPAAICFQLATYIADLLMCN